jgi:SAM-dependent methyltransferase
MTPALLSGAKLRTRRERNRGKNPRKSDKGSEMIQQMVPPVELNFVGSGGFLATGQEFLQHFTNVGGLKPHHRVLDVGCGIGRMAIPLTQYLNAQGSYEGFDIVDIGIEWCQQHITPLYPNFQFQMADVYNSAYNRKGRFDPWEYVFPYADESFDFVFLTSVFTHMLPRDFENYLAEIARVLKPNGRCFSTFYLHNAESASLLADGRAVFKFVPQKNYWTSNPKMPEDAICLRESYVLSQYAMYGLDVNEPIYYGSWSGRQSTLTSHDVVVATKPRSVPTRRTGSGTQKRVLHHLVARYLRPFWKGRLKGDADAGLASIRKFLAKNPHVLRRSRNERVDRS